MPAPAEGRRCSTFLAAALLGGGAFLGACCQPSKAPSGQPLRAADHVEIAAGETHAFSIDLERDQALEATFEQLGIDLEVEVIDPCGRWLVLADTPTGSHGPELVCFTAPRRGRYRLLARAFPNQQPGVFAISEPRIAPAAAAGRACEAGIRAVGRALKSWGEDVPETSGRAYEEAREHFRRSGHRFQETVALKELCGLERELGRLAEADACYARALEAMRRLGASEEIVSILHHLGLTKGQLGRGDLAREAFEEALTLARSIGDEAGLAAALNNLALLDKQLGEHHKAAGGYLQALEIWRRLGIRREAASTLLNLGHVYAELGRNPEALDHLQEALLLVGEDSLQLGGILMAIGWTHHLAGRPAEAERYLRQAAELAGDRRREAAFLGRLGSALTAGGKLGPAREAFEASLQISLEHDPGRDPIEARANLALLLLDEGQAELARKALAEIRAELDPEWDRDALAHTLAGLARAERQLGNLPAARELLEEGLRITSGLRANGRVEGHWVSPVPLWQGYVEEYVDLLVEMHPLDLTDDALARAFEASDRGRARGLVEMLAESAVDYRSQVPAELLARERAVQDRLEWTAELLQEARRAPGSESAELEAEVRRIRRQLEEVRAEIRTEHPAFAELRTPTPTTLSELQRLLGPETQLLSYALGTRRSFLFLVDAESVEVFSLPGREQLERLVEPLIHSLESSHQPRGRDQVAYAAANAAETLLGPVRGRLTAQRLWVVPEGALLHIPFGALPLGPGTLLLESKQVVHLPSAGVQRILHARHGGRSPAWRSAAAFADPVTTPEDSRFSGLPAVQLDSSPDWPRLPASRQEADTLLSRFSASWAFPFVGFDATVEQALDHQLAGADLLHFATHAVIDDRHPELSGIVLSAFDRQGRPLSRNVLRLHEIFNLRLRAGLVTLSGCSTALGPHLRGEGLLGLARGFFYAGADRLLVSLWQVEDQPTAALMSYFYEELLDRGYPPAEALRRAQLRLRAHPRWQAPYYWAAFVLLGA